MALLGSFWRRREKFSQPPSSVPNGERVYAVGDIHGRLDLLDILLDKIAQDNSGREDRHTTLLFLGDLIDRGLQSAQVVERLRLLDISPGSYSVRFLLGNHEEVLLNALAGDEKALRLFTRIGGRETILSYGLSPEEYAATEYADLLAELRARVPSEHIEFLGRFEDLIVIGDYAFVHAGVRPNEPLSRQKPGDLRWIRAPFLDFQGTLEKIIVHGHTITEEVETLPHRIGLDTGAFASGRLTAMGFERDKRWIVHTAEFP